MRSMLPRTLPLLHPIRSNTVRRISLVSLLVVLLVTGCRTYGGYGTEEETHQQIKVANRQFADELERARADLNLLESAASGNGALQPLLRRYDSLVTVHETMLAGHRAIAENLEGSGDYRELNRAYGAIITDGRLHQDQYQRVIADVVATVSGDSTFMLAEAIPPENRYFVAPIFYQQVRYRDSRPSMQSALRGETQGPPEMQGPESQPTPQPTTPDTEAGAGEPAVPADTTES